MTGEFYQTYKEELSFSNYSKKLNRTETLPNSFYKATITLIPKPDKDTTEKEKHKIGLFCK